MPDPVLTRMTPFDLEEGTAVLERTPAAPRALLAGLPEAWVRATEGPEIRSPFDVGGHPIDGGENSGRAGYDPVTSSYAQVIGSRGPGFPNRPYASKPGSGSRIASTSSRERPALTCASTNASTAPR